MGVLDSLSKNVLGNICKARIDFLDMIYDVVVEEVNEKKDSVLGRGILGADIDSFTDAAKSSLIPDTDAHAMQVLYGELPHSKFNTSIKETGLSGATSLELQFNPQTITISASGGGSHLVNNIVSDQPGDGEASSKTAKNARSAMSWQRIEPLIEVSFDVIFDETLNSDAFLEDRLKILNPNPKGIANTVLAATKTFSVKPMVEGLVGAVRNPYHRHIRLSWGSMSYTGMLNNVTASYNMYSPSGEPIRATVHFNIVCDMNNYNDWEEKYCNALGDKKDLFEITNGAIREKKLGNFDRDGSDEMTQIFTNVLGI